MAFRPRLLAGLALTDVTSLYALTGEARQFGDVPKLEPAWEALSGMTASGYDFNRSLRNQVAKASG